MSDDKRKEFVDELLDAALHRYAQAEPRAGFEEHLLAAVPEQAQRFAWPQWVWIPAAATAALLLAVLVFYATRQTPAPSAPSVAREVPAPTMAPPVVTELAPAPHPRVSRVRIERKQPGERLGAGPRLATLPARAPLSEQERLLLLFVQQAPKEQLMARQLGAPIERLEIKPLAVPPLEIPKPTTEN
ncbi:MAG TPA: hypothetical protein VNN18_10920 [Candidatus Xenobia bacterium]|nr:hypothetical protein [Candidatus Xenobia bacterium]